MSENSGALDRAEWTKYTENGGGSRGCGDASNPESTGGTILKLTLGANTWRTGGADTTGCRSGSTDRRRDWIIVGCSTSDGRHRWRAIRFPESNSDELAVGHADIASQSV